MQGKKDKNKLEKCDFHVHYHAKTPTQKKKKMENDLFQGFCGNSINDKEGKGW